MGKDLDCNLSDSFKQGILLRAMLSTVNLHIKVVCFVKDVDYIFNIKRRSSKLVKCYEVNGTEPSPTVRLPWL
jgi:hypothetical protein